MTSLKLLNHLENWFHKPKPAAPKKYFLLSAPQRANVYSTLQLFENTDTQWSKAELQQCGILCQVSRSINMTDSEKTDQIIHRKQSVFGVMTLS